MHDSQTRHLLTTGDINHDDDFLTMTVVQSGRIKKERLFDPFLALEEEEEVEGEGGDGVKTTIGAELA